MQNTKTLMDNYLGEKCRNTFRKTSTMISFRGLVAISVCDDDWLSKLWSDMPETNILATNVLV